MPKTITEPRRSTPVAAEVDVLVVGAGPAGLGAAIAAARAGANVLLIEQHGCLGGMLTLGGVQNIRTYNDGQNQVIGGVAAELAERIGAAGGTEHTPTSYTCIRQDPEITKFVAQEMVEQSGAGVLLHTLLAGAIVDGDVLRGAIVENKSGRGAILAACTVDATGDGDMICRAGAEFQKADELQPMTLTFVLGGVECWPETKTPAMRQVIERAIADGTFPTPRGAGALFPMWRKGYVYANATHAGGDCTDAASLTAAEFDGRRQVMALVDWYRRNVPEYRNAYLAATGGTMGLRESRRLVGLYELTRQDVLGYREFDDKIARGSYMIDVHKFRGAPGPRQVTGNAPDAAKGRKDGEMTRLEKGRSYSIPYRCLVPRRMDGLLASGRCLAADRDALGSVRVMAICLATGQAAGLAAALSARQGLPARAVNVQVLQQALLEQKAIL